MYLEFLKITAPIEVPAGRSIKSDNGSRWPVVYVKVNLRG